MFRNPWKRLTKIEPSQQVNSPYALAHAEWDVRMGLTLALVRRWQRMSAFLSFVIVVLLMMLFWHIREQSIHRDRVYPYIIAVDPYGHPTPMGVIGKSLSLEQRHIRVVLMDLIRWIRSKPVDAVVFEDHWKRASAILEGDALQTAQQFHISHQSNKDFRITARHVQIVNVVSQSETTYQVRWRETHFERGSEVDKQNWTAFLTFETRELVNADDIEKNPYGIFVIHISWEQDFRSQ